MNNKEEILINVVMGGEKYSVSTFRNEYRSLMELIRDKVYPDGFGECGGMGKCATCQVQFENAHIIAGLDRNESSTLLKQGITDQSIRLSCQLLIDTALNNVTVSVLDSYSPY